MFRRPGRRVTYPTAGEVAGATIPTTLFVFGVKYQKSLLALCVIVCYYKTTGWYLTPGNITWDFVIKNLAEKWKALKDWRSNDNPEVPKITKALPLIKWTQAFQYHLHRVIGVQKHPFGICNMRVWDSSSTATTPSEWATKFLITRIYGGSNCRSSFPLTRPFRDYKSRVYYFVKEANRTRPYATSIQPFQIRKAGRDAWMAPTSKYSGQDKWEQ